MSTETEAVPRRETIALPGVAPGTRRSVELLRFGPPGARPKAYLQAGLHADELPGMLVLHKLARLLAEAEGRGAVSGEVVRGAGREPHRPRPAHAGLSARPLRGQQRRQLQPRLCRPRRHGRRRAGRPARPGRGRERRGDPRGDGRGARRPRAARRDRGAAARAARPRARRRPRPRPPCRQPGGGASLYRHPALARRRRHRRRDRRAGGAAGRDLRRQSLRRGLQRPLVGAGAALPRRGDPAGLPRRHGRAPLEQRCRRRRSPKRTPKR